MKTLKFKFIAAAIAVFVINADTASAQAVRANYSVNAEEPFVVKYLGIDGGYLLFEVTVHAAETKIASLDISDMSEGELYAESFRADSKVKKVKIEKRDNQELNFKLELDKAIYSKSFSVKTNRIENTVVSENNTTVL